MVAGDTKRIIVIKNISSNLIEEAILILKNEPVAKECNEPGDSSKRKDVKNDFILKEAENIINQYIKENGLFVSRKRRGLNSRKIPGGRLSVNAVINILLFAAMLFLLIVISKGFK